MFVLLYVHRTRVPVITDLGERHISYDARARHSHGDEEVRQAMVYEAATVVYIHGSVFFE